MTHAKAMSENRGAGAGVTCEGMLIDGSRSFSSDVYWEVYTCEKCLETVFTVEGGVHNWNHHGEPSESRAARQQQMRFERAAIGEVG